MSMISSQISRQARQQQVRRQKTILYCIAVAVVIFFILILSMKLFGTTNRAVASASGHYEYESILICAGDTLWDIAHNYQNTYPGTITQFIQEVTQINQLCSDTIKAGECLIIPVYCSEAP